MFTFTTEQITTAKELIAEYCNEQVEEGMAETYEEAFDSIEGTIDLLNDDLVIAYMIVKKHG